MSSFDATLPSRCAAIPSKTPTVITPVPPIPFKEYCRKYRRLAKSVMEFHRNHPFFRQRRFRLHFAAFHCDEAGTETFGNNLYCTTMVNRAFATNSVSTGMMDVQFDCATAITTAFAYSFVDEHALIKSGIDLSYGDGVFLRRKSDRRSAPWQPSISLHSRCTASGYLCGHGASPCRQNQRWSL